MKPKITDSYSKLMQCMTCDMDKGIMFSFYTNGRPKISFTKNPLQIKLERARTIPSRTSHLIVFKKWQSQQREKAKTTAQ